MTELTPTNHGLMKLVKARIEANYPMTFIAQELGVHVDELCDWVLRVYREPKHKSKPYINRMSSPLEFSEKDAFGGTANARRFAAWRKAQEGAAETRRMLELSHSVGAE